MKSSLRLVAAIAVAYLSGLVPALILPDMESLIALEAQVVQVFSPPAAAGVPESGASTMAPLHVPELVDTKNPHRYIVVLKTDISLTEVEVFKTRFMQLHTASVQFNTGELETRMHPRFFTIHTVSGFVADLPPQLLAMVRMDHRVMLVERDGIISIAGATSQKGSPWGLDRISHRGSMDAEKIPEYLYDDDAGRGVDAYVIDTGIKTELEEFENRATWGSAVATPNDLTDHNGHGTHVAGILGSRTYGVAKKVNLIAVGVMKADGKGVASDAVSAVEFAVKEHKAKIAAKNQGYKGLVINMSLTGGIDHALDLIVDAATAAGLHVVAAAGNNNDDACNYSPARAAGALAVGATAVNDSMAMFSNWGTCVGILAPGHLINSTFIGPDTKIMSGTSMAAPHISGIMATFLSLLPSADSQFAGGPPDVDPATMKRKVLLFATRDVAREIRGEGTPNLVGFNGAGAAIGEFWDNL